MYEGDLFEERTDQVAGFLEVISSGEISRIEYGIDDESSEDTDGQGSADTSSDNSEEANNGDKYDRRRLLFVEENVGPNYAIIADEQVRYFTISCQYQLWADLADSLSYNQAKSIAPEDIDDQHPAREQVSGFEDMELERQERTVAAFEILSSLPKSDERDLIVQLTRVFTNSNLKHVISAVSNTEGISGFNVLHKIFPYEDNFDISELNDKVEQVRMGSHMAELLLKYVFNLPVDINGTTEGDPTEPGNIPDSYAGIELEHDIVDTS